MEDKPPYRGSQPKAKRTPPIICTVRADPAEDDRLRKWKIAAASRGVSLNAYVRDVVDRAAEIDIHEAVKRVIEMR